MPESAAYPYTNTPLTPAWRDHKAQALGATAAVAAAVALWLKLPIAPADLDHIALTIVLPGALAFVLALAPRPATRANRIAKDLVTFATALAVFSGNLLALSIALVPVLLAFAVGIGATPLGAMWWGEAE